MKKFLSADEFTLVEGRPTIAKAPTAVKDYSLNFVDLLPDGAVIESAQVTGDGITIDSHDVIVGGTVVRAWISGGTFGRLASATFTATLTDGQTIDPRTLWFQIQHAA